MKPYGLRDRIAAAACNWILRHVASERYRKMIGGSIKYGLASAAVPVRDLEELIGRETDGDFGSFLDAIRSARGEP